MSKYQDLSKEELLKKLSEFEKELKNKKYGLVWESEKFPEQVVLECENNLPVLEEVKDKEIKTPNCEDDYNILIEGDNYHALTVLNYTHENKINVIYIDPPYNTGNKDFIYNDHYVDKEDSYRHSKWLNFMEKRLKLAKSLLKEDGVIFISIDDNEQAQLKLLCDKIFGEDNFSSLIWQKQDPKVDRNTNSKQINREKRVHEYVFIVFNNKHNTTFSKVMRLPDWSKEGKNPDKDSRGPYQSGIISYEEGHKNEDKNSEFFYTITLPSGREMTRHFFINKDDFNKLNSDNRIYYPKGGDGVPRLKIFQFEEKEYYLDSIIRGFGTSSSAKDELEEILLNRDLFDTPKPTKMIKELIRVISKKDSIVLDFFAGSGTTGHAVLELNKEDSGNRKFILCTNNQNSICEEVTYRRVEKVMNGYNKNGDGEFVEGLGGNLKYFKTSLVKKSKSRSQLKIDITQKCSEMLCLKESIFDEIVKSENYKIFTGTKRDKHLAIYYNFLGDDFSDFIEELKKLNTEIIVYVFSVDNRVDEKLFKGLDVKLEAIPQKILEVYKTLAKMNISTNSDTIFIDFEKAYKRVFEEKDKDDGAIKLRIVLEKILQKLCQLNGIDVINTKGKDEKVNLLNNELGSKKVIDQVLWKQNEFYLTIGNESAHGRYDDYTLEQVQDFYKHVQNLIDIFNI